jgi:transcriptional regulator GlxA family with amidase domain
MKLAFVLYPDMTALDLVGPYDVLCNWPGAEPVFVASTPGPIVADNGLPLAATSGLDDVTDPHIVVVGGSSKPEQPLQDDALISWLRDVRPKWMTSVCTGSGLLAKAGWLDGKRATTHWGWRERLAELGAVPVAERVVFEPPVVTAAGVSAGIDMALELTARELGEEIAKAIQLAIEYDPSPPFDAGSPEKAGPELTAFVGQFLAAAGATADVG